MQRTELKSLIHAIITERLIDFRDALERDGLISRSYSPEPPRTAPSLDSPTPEATG